jgi:hypothetical protein
MRRTDSEMPVEVYPVQHRRSSPAPELGPRFSDEFLRAHPGLFAQPRRAEFLLSPACEGGVGGAISALPITGLHVGGARAARWMAIHTAANISIAALRPLIAITLPPGCVQAPQRNTPGMGVRGVSRLSHMKGGKHSP